MVRRLFNQKKPRPLAAQTLADQKVGASWCDALKASSQGNGNHDLCGAAARLADLVDRPRSLPM
jgi:hypothetical protein